MAVQIFRRQLMYTSFYKLQGKPFQLSPDPRFFFGSSSHKRAMSYLRYGLSQNEGFIVITGGIGTGKTTLVRNLFSELKADEVVAAQLVTTQLDADDMLSLVVAAFGVEHEGVSKAVLIKRLEDFLATSARSGKRVLLVVDEAQNLPIRSLEELRMLSNFQISDKPLLQSFLLGQEGFRTTLESPNLEQLRQRIIASCHLTPLGPVETQDYITHRLSVVGWNDDPSFDTDAFEVIHNVSGGIPRKINVLCDRLLLFGYLEELHELNGSKVKEVARELTQELKPIGATNSSTAGRAPEPASGDESARGLDDDLAAQIAQLGTAASGAASLAALERRIVELESTVAVLRKGFLQLTRVLNRSRIS